MLKKIKMTFIIICTLVSTYLIISLILYFSQRNLLYHPNENNLPLGIQLIGDKYDDHRFLGVARWLEQKSKKYDE